MVHSLRPSALVPRGFVIDETASAGDTIILTVRSTDISSRCPSCGTRSERIHSRYHRRLTDLPIAGKSVRLVIAARRFYCDAGGVALT